MKKFLTQLNIVFTLHLAVLGLIIAGLIPRDAVLFLFGVLVYFFIFAPREDALAYFVRSIPFFVALPLIETFDSLDMGRVLALILFLRIFVPQLHTRTVKNLMHSIRSQEFRNAYRVEILGVLFLVLAAVSIVAAMDFGIALKRFIYITNAIILYPVLFVVVKDRSGFSRIMKNIVAGMLFVVAIAYIQLWTTYLWDFMTFARFWALNVQYNFYGTAWSSIVYHSNTWFAYLGGEGLRLRVFSTFPDSHSFPMYLIMSLASFIALFAPQFLQPGNFVKRLFLFFRKNANGKAKNRTGILLALILLVIILSGTRGIWLSVLFPISATLWTFFRIKRREDIVRLTGFMFLVFILLIPVASYIFSIPQFDAGIAGDNFEKKAFLERFKSSFDPEEVSNQGRLGIWKRTLISLSESPLFGVGIGNFPVILGQNVELAKAGSSAHNLYLQIAGEMGLVAFVVFFLILWEFARSGWHTFKNAGSEELRVFSWISLMSLLWIMGYSLTDAALFDGRVLALFVIFCGMIRKAQKLEKTI